MRIKRIKINNFKSIYNELALDFEEITGFWKIEGNVGSGKTTIGEAIIFGLFGSVSGKSNSSLISWGSNHSLVELWCICKGKNLYIRREINKYGQSPIYVTVDGEEMVSTNKRGTQSQLEQEYYDISKNTLELLCIISFNNFKSLATLNASDTKKFLDQLLGFTILTTYADACKAFKKQSTNEYIEVSNKISSNCAQIDKIIELSNQTKIAGDINEKQENIKKLEGELKQKLTEQEVALNDYTNQLKALQEQLTKIKVLGSNKKKEIDLIKKGVCPTCGASIDQSQLQQKEQEREVLLDQYKVLDNKIKTLSLESATCSNTYKEHIEGLRCNLINEHKTLSILKEQEKRSTVDTRAIENLEHDITHLQQQRDQINVDMSQWEELQNILTDDIRVKILSTFIPTLNSNILKYTQQLRIPYVITFDNNFRCSLSIYGIYDNIPLNSLSTGQLKSVDMCIIMGVLNTIIGNISFNILFMDELFSNMDSELRSSICQIFKSNMKNDQTVFVISHIDIEDKYFDGHIHANLQYIDSVRKESVYNITHSINNPGS